MSGYLYSGFPTFEVWPFTVGAVLSIAAGVAGLVWLRRGKRGQR